MAIQCPECATDNDNSLVVKTTTREDGRQVVRMKKCDKGHRFETVERLNRMSIDEVLVRRTGDGRLADGAFDRVRLLEDVRKGVLKTKRSLPGEDVTDVVNQAIEDVELRLGSIATPLSASEKRARPGYRRAIRDADIREAVEARLRSHGHRLPHVLYALSTLGRADRENRVGFTDARDVLQWMAASYPDLHTGSLPERRQVPVDRWWPTGEPPLPERVIKRDLSTTREFGDRQFRRSIEYAMTGRPGAQETSRLVAQWVLWGLAGQRQVLTSQLAAMVLDCLRRVDDIAYLRWAAVAKNLHAVRELHSEALSLVQMPSTRLQFDVDAMPRRPKGPQVSR